MKNYLLKCLLINKHNNQVVQKKKYKVASIHKQDNDKLFQIIKRIILLSLSLDLLPILSILFRCYEEFYNNIFIIDIDYFKCSTKNHELLNKCGV